MNKLLPIYITLFFSLISVKVLAACSAHVGSATLNEIIKEGGNGDAFIEIKLLDMSISSATYEQWRVRICYKDKNKVKCDDLLVSQMNDGTQWIWGAAPIVDGNFIDFKDGFDLSLLDENNQFIDYIQVQNYAGQNFTDSCSYDGLEHVFSVPDDITNGTKILLRKPDGTGGWLESKNLNEYPPTPGASNDGSSTPPQTDYCASTFVNGATTHETSGKIKFEDDPIIYNDKDGILATTTLEGKNGGTLTCEGFGHCNKTDAATGKLELGSFIDSTDKAAELNVSSNVTIGNSGENNFGTISVTDGGILNFSSDFSQYYIEKMTLLKSKSGEAVINLPAGDYYIGEFNSDADTSINVVGNGVVRLFFREHSDFEGNTKANIAGNVQGLLIYTFDVFHIKDTSEVKGLVYSQTKAELKDNTVLTGSISAGSELKLKDESKIYYSCDSNDPPTAFFQINHDGQGLTCDEETVTIKACADADCSTLNSDAVDVQLSINGTVVKTVTISGGSTNTSFPYTNVGAARLSLDQTYVCKNGGSESCAVVFADAGFRFLYGTAESTTIDPQISGDNFIDVLKLQAVENVNGVCTGLFTGNMDVELSQKNATPLGTSGLSFNVDSTPVAKYPTYSNNITLNFGAESKAIIPVPVYLDAGQINLQAKYDVGGISLEGSSNNFWVSPKKLIVIAKSADSDINASTNTSPIKHKAGQAFDFTVTAVNSLGATTLNYTPNDMQLLLTRTGPITGGVEGRFNYGNGAMLSALTPTYQSVTLTAFNSGFSSTGSAYYSEVGLLHLDLQDVNYGYSGNTIAGDAINIGRFYPDHFDVTITNNSFADTCISGGSDFTYIGQPFYYLNAPVLSIAAKNSAGVTTQNYTQLGYQKLVAADVNRTFPTKDNSKNGADNATKMTVLSTIQEGNLTTPSTVPASNAGVMNYTFNDSDSFTYNKDANSLVATFTMDYDIILNSIEDNDGANASIDLAANVPSSNTVSPTGVNFRFGRWIIENTFGSERENLTFSMTTQHYNGTKFVSNTLDNCTTFDGDNHANYSLTLNGLANPLSSTHLTAITGIGIFSLGFAELGIAKPSDGSQGQIRLSYDNTPVWLKYDWDWNGVDVKSFDENPNAVATFGLFRGNDRIIYQREVHE